MGISRFVIAYILSISLLLFSVFGIFHDFVVINDENLAFYIRNASAFFAVVSLLLVWYYSNILIKKKTLETLNTFGFQMVNFDASKITTDDAIQLASDVMLKLKAREIQKFALLGFSIPFFVASITTAIMILNTMGSTFLFSIFVTTVLCTVMVWIASRIISICDVRSYKDVFGKFVENAIEAAKGIQFYNSQDFIFNKLAKAQKNILNRIKCDVSKFVWKAFFYICFLFIFVCISYITKIEYVRLHLFNIAGYESLFLSFLFFYVVSCGSFFKFLKMNDTNIKNAMTTCDVTFHKLDGEKKLPDDRIFIAFHGVYFQDPTKISDVPLLNDISFSALPGEQISITGENLFKGTHIFELILKYYLPQSGKIYISGMPTDNLQISSIRSSIGIFMQDFGIVRGTVYENLAMLAIDDDKILAVSEQVGLQDNLNDEIYDDYDTSASQEILFKIQIARIAILKPKIILIETPLCFSSKYTEEIFYAFVEHFSRKSTIFIITDNPKVVIYSDKILYLGIGESIFGTHAELSKNRYYQDYIRSLNV